MQHVKFSHLKIYTYSSLYSGRFCSSNISTWIQSFHLPKVQLVLNNKINFYCPNANGEISADILNLHFGAQKAVYSFIPSILEWWYHLVASHWNKLELAMNRFKRYFNLHGAKLEARSFSYLLATLSSPLNFSEGYMDLQGIMQNNNHIIWWH